MAAVPHTYGPTCLLHNTQTGSIAKALLTSDDVPEIKAQFFYSSALTIDDPLAPIPPPPISTSTKPLKLPPRPFSIHDNAALDKAWLKQQNEEKESAPHTQSLDSKLDAEPSYPQSPYDYTSDQRRSLEITNRDFQTSRTEKSESNVRQTDSPPKRQIRRQGGSRKRPSSGNIDLTLSDDPRHVPFDEALPVNEDEMVRAGSLKGTKKKRNLSPFRRKDRPEQSGKSEQIGSTASSFSDRRPSQLSQLASSLRGRDTSGTPFLRIQSKLRRSRSRSRSPDYPAGSLPTDGTYSPSLDTPFSPSSRPSVRRLRSDRSEAQSVVEPKPRRGESPLRRTQAEGPQSAGISVGTSRLHSVDITRLKVGLDQSER